MTITELSDRTILMGLGSYIAGIFNSGKSQRMVESIGVGRGADVVIKEVPVLLPVPLNFRPTGRTWERHDAENLERFLGSETGMLFQEYLSARYAKELLGLTSDGVYAARGMQELLKTARELANPSAYGSEELQSLSRINTGWGAGILPRKK